MDEHMTDYGIGMMIKLPMKPGEATMLEHAGSVESTDLIDITATWRAFIKLRWGTIGEKGETIIYVTARTEGKLIITVISYNMTALMRIVLVTRTPIGIDMVSACRETLTQVNGFRRATTYLAALKRGGTATVASSTRVARNDLGTKNTSTCTAVIDPELTTTNIADITDIGVKLIAMEGTGRDSADEPCARTTAATTTTAPRRRKRMQRGIQLPCASAALGKGPIALVKLCTLVVPSSITEVPCQLGHRSYEVAECGTAHATLQRRQGMAGAGTRRRKYVLCHLHAFGGKRLATLFVFLPPGRDTAAKLLTRGLQRSSWELQENSYHVLPFNAGTHYSAGSG